MKRSILSAAILGALGLGSTFSALAANNYTVDLCVGEVPGTAAGAIHPALDGVPVWGYALGGATGGACNNSPSLPGPTIRIPDQDSLGSAYDGLTVNLVNTMTDRPTSIVIPGTIKQMFPQTFADDTGLQRVRSFDIEAAANGGIATYHWNNLPSGSYMYHSGTQPQVQVQMGLYGGVINDEVDGSIAYTGKPYTQDVVVFYSEIDPDLHIRAQSGHYDLGTGKSAPSTVDYSPQIFLLSVDEDSTGQQVSFDFTDVPTLKVTNGLNPLFRLYNAGQRLHVPTVANASFDVLAQDAKVMPNSAVQYTVSLPPLKVKDAVLNITGNPSVAQGGAGSFRMTDSTMNISNPAGTTGAALQLASGSGATDHSNETCLACLDIEVASAAGYVADAPSSVAPIAVQDKFTVQEGGKVLHLLSKALNNDRDISGAMLDKGSVKVAIVSAPTRGDLINVGGSYTYQHGGGEDAHDSIVYSITNAAGESSSTSATINVAPVNDAPVAEDDVVTTSLDHAMIEIRPLNNDVDVDSTSISIVDVATSSLGELTAQDKVIVFKPTTEGSDVVAYRIADSEGKTASANINITVAAATAASDGVFGGGSVSTSNTDVGGVPPVALDDTYSVAAGGTLDIPVTETIRGVMANDTGADGVETVLKTFPAFGTILMRDNGTFTYVQDGGAAASDSFVYEVYNADGKATAEVVIQIKE